MSVESQLALLHRVELQIEKWEFSTARKIPTSETVNDSRTSENPVITISGEPGCGTGSIARMLTQEFGLDLFGVELVDLIAKSAHLSRQLVATLDEKTQSAIEDMFAESLCEEHFSSKTYLQNLRAVVFTIAAHGNAVIIGRGANFLLQPETRLAIRLIAPFETRLKKVMQDQRLSEKNSRDYIAEIEKQRRLFVCKNFHADIEDPSRYDVVINTATVGATTVIEIVKVFLNRKMPAERNRRSIGEWSAEIIA